MATPARQLIAANLKSSLEAITVVGGYKSTVVTVEPVLRTWDEIGDSDQMPWIGFMLEPDQVAHQPFGTLDITIPVVIVAHLNVTEANRATLVNNIIDDVIAALELDTTRGANAVQTLITEIATDEADPDTEVSKGGEATVQIKANVEYQRTTSSS